MQTFLSTFALFAFATTLFAQGPFVGTWKADTTKAKFTAGAPGKNSIIVIEEQGDSLRVTSTATSADGSPFLLKYTLPLKGGIGQVQESTGRLDGVSSRVAGANVRENTFTRDGKQAALRRWVVSKDRMTMTVVESGADKDGKPFASTNVFRKQ
jgi:hypothetical protein